MRPAMELIHIKGWKSGAVREFPSGCERGLRELLGPGRPLPWAARIRLYSPDKFLVSTKFLSALSHSSTATTPGVGKQSVGFLPAEALAAPSQDCEGERGVRPNRTRNSRLPSRGGCPTLHVRGVHWFRGLSLLFPFSSLPSLSLSSSPPNMSTGSLSDVDDLQEVEMLDCDGLKMDSNKEFVTSNESTEESSNCETGSPQKGRGGLGKRRKAPTKKSPLSGVSQEGKQVQRNAANARERARMRVLSKAFSRLKTTLPWVPPDTKLSKLDTLRLASSYIAHLRQILANDKYENGYIHPVNLVSSPVRRRRPGEGGGGDPARLQWVPGERVRASLEAAHLSHRQPASLGNRCRRSPHGPHSLPSKPRERGDLCEYLTWQPN